MEGANLIAQLLPVGIEACSKQTWDTIRQSDNRSRYISPQKEVRPERSCRERTVPVEDQEEAPDPDSLPKLQLTFDNGPKVGQKFVMGRDRNSCDIVLPNHPNISRQHCLLTFDDHRRLILQDTSVGGTTVKYGGQGGEKRRTLITHDNRGKEIRHHFTWILSGDEVPNRDKKIKIIIADFEFEIKISKHETHPDQYMKNVDRFLQRKDELPIGALGLQSTTSTIEQSEAFTPRLQLQVPIYIDQETLGTGYSSVVKRVWNVSTGFWYASKQIINMRESEWRREVEILRRVSQLSNDHIVHFVGLLENPSPRLILEYLPLGNLKAQQGITDTESLTILCQSLDALTSVHEDGIAHRDVKPENILVLSRYPLQIKLSDFGLSKASLDLQTFCGTHEYAAPEIYRTGQPTYYTKACDIWSIGVVVFEYAYGPLPRLRKNDRGLPWCQKIVDVLHDWDSDDLVDLLSSAMLIIEPGSRRCARACWDQALQISWNRCGTPTAASCDSNYLASGRLSPIPLHCDRRGGATLTQGDRQSQHQGPFAEFANARKRSMQTSPSSLSARRKSKCYEKPVPTPSRPNTSPDKYQVGGDYDFDCALAKDSEQLSNQEVAHVLPLDTPDHISTRSLLSDREGLIYMVIRRHAVAMRKTDYKLDAAQICKVAELHKGHRRNYMDLLKSHCHVAQVKAKTGRDHAWIPFKDGVFLCQALNLYGELRPLLSLASADIPREEENYFLNRRRPQAKLPVEYKGLQWDDKLVVYMPSARRVNATHLLKVHDVPRAKLAQFFSQNRPVSKQVVQGGTAYRGTYINFEDARLLCQHFHFGEDLVDEIVGRARTTGTPLLEDHANADNYHHGVTYNADDKGTCEDGATNQESPNLGLQHSASGHATAATHHINCTELQTSFQDAEPVLDRSHISYYTEPSYRYGSFLPVVNQSFLAPANPL
ncbi:MAG: hypothetical protein Q9173_001866 [Seirophora scorigena]